MEREERSPIVGVAEIWKSGRSLGKAQICNLSEGGVGVVGMLYAYKGDPVVILLNGIGRVRGKVAWIGDGGFGIAFDKPIDAEKFDFSMPIRRDANGRAQHSLWRPGS
ncbi:MAG: PilZ domain-containing protein [Sphingomonadaceae bacterium]|nr:PilZ domain-containing protein [Sphingomonadaceae bacterium]